MTVGAVDAVSKGESEGGDDLFAFGSRTVPI
jgi:hypothetical protein